MNIFDVDFPSIRKEYTTPAGQPSMCLTEDYKLVGFERETGIVYTAPSDIHQTRRIVRVKPLRADVPVLDAICEAVAAPVGSLIEKDSKGSLVLVDYKALPSGAAPASAGHVRGIVVDTDSGCIVSANQFGHTPVAVSDRLPVSADGESFSIVDTEGQEHAFDQRRTVVKKYFEGVALEVFYWGGEMYVRNRSKLDTSRSYFGGSDFFRAMYDRAGGPTVDQLYDTSKLYSPWQYSFILVDPPLCLGTRQVVQAPYLVHIATTKLWSTDPVWIPAKYAGSTDDHEATISGSSELPRAVTASFVHTPRPLSWLEADYLLDCGHLPSVLHQGEPVIAYDVDEIGTISNIVKIYPSLYQHRLSVVPKGDPREVYYSTLSKIHDPSISRADFFAEFPYRGHYTPDQLRARIAERPIYELGRAALPAFVDDATELQLRREAVWLALVVASPLSRQADTVSLLEDADANAATLVTWFLANEPKIDLRDPKVKKMYGAALVSFVDRYRRVLSRRPKTAESRRRLLDEFLASERGDSLFHITNKVRTIVATDRKFEQKRAQHAAAK